MTIRDIKVINELIQNNIDLGLTLDKTLNEEFEKIKNIELYIFSGIDFIHDFFNFERKIKNDF